MQGLAKFISLIAVAASHAGGVSGAPMPMKSTEVEALVRVSHEVCQTPALFGITATGKAQAEAGISVPKIIARLTDLKLSAIINSGGQVWYGILQKDSAGVITATNDCAERVFTDMFNKLSLGNAATGEKIKRPSDLHAAFHDSSNLDNFTTTLYGSSGINTINQIGGTNTIINQHSPHLIGILYIGDDRVGTARVTKNDPTTETVELEAIFMGPPPSGVFAFNNKVLSCDVTLAQQFGGISHVPMSCKIIGDVPPDLFQPPR